MLNVICLSGIRLDVTHRVRIILTDIKTLDTKDEI